MKKYFVICKKSFIINTIRTAGYQDYLQQEVFYDGTFIGFERDLRCFRLKEDPFTLSLRKRFNSILSWPWFQTSYSMKKETEG